MRIYTKTGDQGETGLFGGPRVFKDDPRIEAYGSVDELNASLGLARTEALPDDLQNFLGRVQNDLFAVGAELATPDPAAKGTILIGEEQILALEGEIDRLEVSLAPLSQFILPTGTRGAAALHVSRGVCRRAERRVVALLRESPNVSDRIVRYLNRLSDYLFVASRYANAQANVADEPWQKP